MLLSFTMFPFYKFFNLEMDQEEDRVERWVLEHENKLRSENGIVKSVAAESARKSGISIREFQIKMKRLCDEHILNLYEKFHNRIRVYQIIDSEETKNFEARIALLKLEPPPIDVPKSAEELVEDECRRILSLTLKQYTRENYPSILDFILKDKKIFDALYVKDKDLKIADEYDENISNYFGNLRRKKHIEKINEIESSLGWDAKYSCVNTDGQNLEAILKRLDYFMRLIDSIENKFVSVENLILTIDRVVSEKLTKFIVSPEYVDKVGSYVKLVGAYSEDQLSKICLSKEYVEIMDELCKDANSKYGRENIERRYISDQVEIYNKIELNENLLPLGFSTSDDFFRMDFLNYDDYFLRWIRFHLKPLLTDGLTRVYVALNCPNFDRFNSIAYLKSFRSPSKNNPIKRWSINPNCIDLFI